MNKVYSQDGTPIAYDEMGEGPTLVLVSGAMGVRKHTQVTDLVSQLQSHFNVVNYDRRGRGDSGNTLPYAIEREVEDIEALIDEVGGSAFLYGLSSGAVLALDAAHSLGQKVQKAALYEPPFIVDDNRAPVPDDYVEQLDKAIEAGRPGDAVEIFMTKALLMPQEVVAQMKAPQTDDGGEAATKPPQWLGMEKVAHTLAYDGRIMGGTMSGKPLPPQRWANVSAPVLIVVGGKSEGFFHNGAQALAEQLADGRVRVLEGQDHAVSPAALAPVLLDFFAGEWVEDHAE